MAKLDISDILELSIAERIELVQDIWDSIASIPESLELTEEQKLEIDRRIAHLDKAPLSSIPWNDLKAKIGL